MNKKSTPTAILKFFGDYRFLSNFWLAKFEWDGVIWPSTECAYQAAKANDKTIYEHFAKMSPGESKRAGKGSFTIEDPVNKTKRVQKFTLRADWEQVKVQIMYEVVYAKFSQNEHLKKLLLDTGNALLEEGNTWGDRIWGVSPPGSGNGRNELGKVLMLVRSQLRGDIEL